MTYKRKLYLITKPNWLEKVEIHTTTYTHYIKQKDKIRGVVSINREITESEWKTYGIDVEDKEYYEGMRQHGLVIVKRTKLGAKIIECENATILKVREDTKYENSVEELIKRSIEVTGSKYFTEKSLLTQKRRKIILEGADFSGKTTLAKKLVNRGIIVQERDLENFSFWIREFIPEPSEIIKEKIKNRDECYLVLTVSDKVLEKRMKTREDLTEFDKKAKISNEIYKNLKIEGLENIEFLHIENEDEDSYEKFEKLMADFAPTFLEPIAKKKMDDENFYTEQTEIEYVIFNGFSEISKSFDNLKAAYPNYFVDISDFLNILKEKIKQKNQLKKKVFEELNYEEDYDLVTRILFLFNVISTMKSNHSRYPFNLHKSEKWSLEHIHAQKSENITKIEDRKDNNS